MRIKIYCIILLAAICLLTACPAPEFDHVIINQSDSILEVEYEYVLPPVKYDSSRLDAPVKMNLAQYAGEDAEKKWIELSAPNEFAVEAGREETIVNAQTNQSYKQQVKTVRLKLLPGEVLRVFVSGHINSDLKNLQRISLKGEHGRLEITGAGFEQFAAYRPARFFTDNEDFRIVYK